MTTAQQWCWACKRTNFTQHRFFNELALLRQHLKDVKGVVDILSIPEAATLYKIDTTEKLGFGKIFHAPYSNAQTLDSDKQVFENLPLQGHSV